ncbi:DNA-binding transcriptional repressor DeoR [Photobacterium japonica]|uniref:DNA-binding transcriptional repressor DeoR n=1 Tax=Photobacterium japonica TaxID=2910235 RepID=UPI003D0D1DDA
MMETKQEKRIRQLVELLHRKEKIHLKQAAEALSVSEMTLRRDLIEPLAGLSVIGGYIINNQRHEDDYTYCLYEQHESHVREKSEIGKCAAAYIRNNDTVFFDNGTTIVHIIHAIDEHISFTGVCFSLNVFLALKNKPNCHPILCGGGFDSQCNHFYPISENNELDDLRIDIMFASAAGIDRRQGVTCHALTEIPYKRQAMKQSQTVILVVDSSKIGVVRKAAVCRLSAIDAIICDQPLSEEWASLVGQPESESMSVSQ